MLPGYQHAHLASCQPVQLPGSSRFGCHPDFASPWPPPHPGPMSQVCRYNSTSAQSTRPLNVHQECLSACTCTAGPWSARLHLGKVQQGCTLARCNRAEGEAAPTPAGSAWGTPKQLKVDWAQDDNGAADTNQAPRPYHATQFSQCCSVCPR